MQRTLRYIKAIIVLGIVLLIVPFLGLPLRTKSATSGVIGLLIVAIGIVLARKGVFITELPERHTGRVLEEIHTRTLFEKNPSSDEHEEQHHEKNFMA